MKKILDNNWFAVILVAVQVICLLIGIDIAVHDDWHAWIAIFVLILIGLFLLSAILMVCALIVKSVKRWLYIALTVIWFLCLSPMLEDIFYALYMENEMEDIQEEMKEYEQSQMKADSIYYLDSVQISN